MAASASSRLYNVFNHPIYVRRLQELMPKVAFRGLSRKHSQSQGGLQSPGWKSLPADPATTPRKKNSSPTSADVDPKFGYTVTIENLEPPFAMLASSDSVLGYSVYGPLALRNLKEIRISVSTLVFPSSPSTPKDK